MDWYRCYHGAPSDPKWLVIARKAKVEPVVVVGVFWMLLDYASQHSDRGSVAGFDIEVAAAFLGIEEEDALAVVSAFEGKSIIVANKIANWEKRQPKREDNSTPRVQRYRNAKSTDETQCNADETQSNEVKQQEREIERKKERKTDPLSPTHAYAEAPASGVLSSSSEKILLEADSDPKRSHWREKLASLEHTTAPRIPEAWRMATLQNWLSGDGAPDAPISRLMTPEQEEAYIQKRQSEIIAKAEASHATA